PTSFTLSGMACGPAGSATATPAASPPAGTASPTPTPTVSTPLPTGSPTPVGAPAQPVVSGQRVDGVGGGLYYDVRWNRGSGTNATSWQLLEDDRVIYTAPLVANSPNPQNGSYRVQDHTYGVYTYRVILTNGAGATTSDPAVYAVGGASKIVVDAVDVGQQAAQATVNQGTTDLGVRMVGVASPRFTLATNNSSVLGYQLASPTTLRLQGLRAGRASLRITETTTGEVRYLGVRVRTADGQLPGLPDYLALGSVSEDSDADLGFWRAFAADAPNTGTGKRMDVRYIYINGGPLPRGRPWAPPGRPRPPTLVPPSHQPRHGPL